MPDHPTIAVVLAAGGSTRMGRPKALLDVEGRTLLRRHVEAFGAVGLSVRVATGGHGAAIGAEARAAGAQDMPNPAWRETGLTDSLLACTGGLPDAAHLLVTPVDVPPAPPAVLRALLDRGGAAVACVHGADAHPVCVGVGRLRALAPGQTLRDALRGVPRVEVPFPDGLRNLNTPEDFRRWRAAVAARG